MKIQRLKWVPKYAISDKQFWELQDDCEKVKDKRAQELIRQLLYIVYDLDQRVRQLKDHVGEKTVR